MKRFFSGGFLLAVSLCLCVYGQSSNRQQILSTMKRATMAMEKLSTNGGYVWAYLPDLSRRWGEMEAFDSMIWIQPPGTPTMGHLFLDAYHATGDEYYYQAAERVAGALIWGQHSSGGWNYIVDFAGDRSLKEWYATIGKNGWRLEEFQHYSGNATFDDAATAESAKFLLRLYVEKRDPKYKPALDKAIQFVIDSQYPIGGWPQRYPLRQDYSAYITLNDDVAAQNIDLLVMCYQALGDSRVLDSITRGMNAFLVTQQGAPQPGWALQYTLDLKPAGARTYEPNALVTHTTALNIEQLLKFYRLTGETKFLARIPEALDWLDSLKLPAGVAIPSNRTHPTFVEVGTNRALYVHREGSNVVNGRYFFDYSPKATLAHYSAFRRIEVDALRKQYVVARSLSAREAVKDSPLATGRGLMPLPRFFAVETTNNASIQPVIAGLNADGYWLAPLGMNSHRYRGDGSTKVSPGDFSQSNAGDDTDTSPYPDEKNMGISTEVFIRNMSVLIRSLN
jgi:PelA/Pel-15E family pectate lyase